jgi:hypothetical protein
MAYTVSLLEPPLTVTKPPTVPVPGFVTLPQDAPQVKGLVSSLKPNGDYNWLVPTTNSTGSSILPACCTPTLRSGILVSSGLRSSVDALMRTVDRILVFEPSETLPTQPMLSHGTFSSSRYSTILGRAFSNCSASVESAEIGKLCPGSI